MKEKILLFIIGLLLGAVIATAAFFVYIKATNSNCNNQNIQMNGGTPPSMPNSQNGQPPEKPNDNNTQDNSNTSQNN